MPRTLPVTMPATPAAPVWTAVDLNRVGTDFLRSLDLRRAPSPAAADAIRQMLAARRNER